MSEPRCLATSDGAVKCRKCCAYCDKDRARRCKNSPDKCGMLKEKK